MIASNGTSMLNIGDRVLLDNRLGGVVRHFGDVDFAPGLWVGLELDEPVGKNNGTVKDKEYFKCPDRHGIFTLQSRVQLQPRYMIGDRVVVQQTHVGTVRYVGETTRGHGQWIGVELAECHGKNDGSVEGLRYFSCPPGHGVFMRPRHVRHAVTRVPRRNSFNNSSTRLAAALNGAHLSEASIDAVATRSRSNTRNSENDVPPASSAGAVATTTTEAIEEADGPEDSGVTSPTVAAQLQDENKRLKLQITRLKNELAKERRAVQEALPTAHITGDAESLRHEIVEQRAVVNELAEMLETAKRSLVACADRESDLRSELARTRALAETFSWRVEDVDISNDALRAQREEAVEEWNEAEDRRAALEMDLFDCKREMLDAMQEISELTKRNHDLAAYIATLQGRAPPGSTPAVDEPAAAAASGEVTVAASSAVLAEPDSTEHVYPEKIPDEVGMLSDDEDLQIETVPSEAGAPSDDGILTVDVGRGTPSASDAAGSCVVAVVDGDNDLNLFCETCETYGHVAEDCDDTITF